MLDSKFYVLGNNEYNIFKTVDNGKTWSHCLTDSCSVTTANNGDGRIIIYSSENRGLKYTDDGFATVDDSNVMDGNWSALEMELDEKGNPVTDKIYANSLDGRGIWVTYDFGETWSMLAKGKATKINKDKEGNLVLSGDKDIIKVDKNDNPQVFPNSSYTPEGEVKPKVTKEMQYGLYYILNKVIIPQLSSILIGDSNMKNLEYNNTTMYKSFWTDGQVYKVTPNDIDFYADVGMRPFHTSDIKDYNELQEAANQTIIDINTVDKEQNITPKLQKTFNIMDSIINNYKSLVLAGEGREVSKKDEDYTGLTEEEIPTMKFFYDIKKGALMSVKGTIINSIFTFDNSKRTSLLKASIIKAADLLKATINADLSSIEKRLENGFIEDVPEGMFNYDILKAWKDGLYYCIEDYYRQCKTNINIITADEDRDLITVAAKKYKTIRENLLDVVTSDIIYSLNMPTNDKNDNIVKGVSENFKLFQEKISGCVDLWRSSILEHKPIPRGELDSMIDEALNKYKQFNDSIKEKTPDYGLEYISREIKNDVYIKIQEEVNVSNDKLKDRFYFDQDDYDEELYKLAPSEVQRVNGYYRQIIDKFKDRCNNLVEIIADGELKKEAMGQLDIYPELLDFSDGIKNHYDDLETFLDSHNIDYLGGIIDNTYSMYLEKVIRQWKKMKEII